MAAFGFKKQFVHPICLGLGVVVPKGFEWIGEAPLPKRQTIRAPRKDGRLAQPGETLHFFYAMRTKSCLKIGLSICRDVRPIILHLPLRKFGVLIDGRTLPDREVEEFARADGFRSVDEMAHFWACDDASGDVWNGFVTRWGYDSVLPGWGAIAP